MQNAHSANRLHSRLKSYGRNVRNTRFKAVAKGALLILALDVLLMLGVGAWIISQIPADLPSDAFEVEFTKIQTTGLYILVAIAGSIICVLGARLTARESAPDAVVGNAVALAAAGVVVSLVGVFAFPRHATEPPWFTALGFASIPIATWVGVCLAGRSRAPRLPSG